MATLHHHQHRIKAPNPKWLLKATPPSKDTTKKPPNAPTVTAIIAYPSPLLLSPSRRKKVQKNKKNNSKYDSSSGPADPSSPRISCMGQIKRNNSTRSSTIQNYGSTSRGYDNNLAKLTMGFFGRNARARASSKVSDMPCSSPFTSGMVACVIDPPLPVVRRVRDENAVSLWERRRGGASALQGLRLR